MPCQPCTPEVVVNVPGVNGTNGINAFTTLTASLVLPAVGIQVTAFVASTAWMAQGQNVFISDGNHNANMLVDVITSPTQVSLTFLGYTNDFSPGTTINSGASVVPGGVIGVSGVSAYTTLTSNFTIPNPGSNQTALVANSSWMATGENVFLSDGVNIGNYKVISSLGPNAVVLQFLNYQGDTATGATILQGAVVTPSGPQGQNVGYTILKVRNIFQGTVSYTPSGGALALYVECIGGGGSGGGGGSTAADASIGSGGGGGAYSAVFLTGLKANYTVQVGSGGAAPTAGANPGNAGQDTTFDTGPSVCTAKGGGAGGAGAAPGTTPIFVAGGAGGVAASGLGDLKLDGNAGGTSNRVSGTVGASGQGAAGPLGGGPIGAIAQGAGVAGGNYGAGGSGGCTLNGGAATAGGAGANGLIRIWELA